MGQKGKGLSKVVFKYLSKTVAHDRGICKVRIRVLCDKTILSLHLFGKHNKMSIKVYARRTGKLFKKTPSKKKEG